MPTELTLLALSAALLFLLILVQATISVMVHGQAYGFGNRDTPVIVEGLEGRAKRAVANLIENLAVFAPLVLIAAVAGVSTPGTMLGAQLFFFGRVAHAVTYLIGVPYARTLAWLVAFIGSLLVFLALFGL